MKNFCLIFLVSLTLNGLSQSQQSNFPSQFIGKKYCFEFKYEKNYTGLGTMLWKDQYEIYLTETGISGRRRKGKKLSYGWEFKEWETLRSYDYEWDFESEEIRGKTFKYYKLKKESSNESMDSPLDGTTWLMEVTLVDLKIKDYTYPVPTTPDEKRKIIRQKEHDQKVTKSFISISGKVWDYSYFHKQEKRETRKIDIPYDESCD